MKKYLSNFYAYFLALFAILSLTLLTLRLHNAISFHAPLQLSTSAFESESLFAIWKVIHGKTLYPNPYHMPFAYTPYNWLYYYVYAYLIKLFLFFFKLNDAWIPTIGRLVTFSFELGSFFLYWKLTAFFKPIREKIPTIIIVLLGVVTFFGPYIGFWAFTVHPDRMAAFFNLLALHGLYALWNKNSTQASIIFSICCYFAWATKQLYIGELSGVCLFFICARLWRPFITTLLTTTILYIATYLIGTKLYIYNTLLSQLHKGHSLALGSHILLFFFAKIFFIIAPLFCLFFVFKTQIISLIKKAFTLHNTESIVTGSLFFSSITTLIMAIPFVFTIGAGDNYFYAATQCWTILFLILWSLYGIDNKRNTLFYSVFVLSVCINCLLTLAILFRFGGVIKTNIVSSQFEDLRCLKLLPKPIFINDPIAMLPWNSNNTYPYDFELAFTYPIYKKLGYHYQYGGIEGMLDKGLIGAYIGPLHPNMKYYRQGSNLAPCKGITALYIKK